ncbi:hypothetical protein M422DRAFT_54126 [Sphaerobolus stellatus SS14]|uniref:DUF6533 domain-containing protein n=1 Tax=Sphaerobolus stellatus (strain SS14) TaxID=990650 RepID=A0A0C9U5L7_SPHS4|nr:hypothetical protein M422DRAFT_54126 [Sphaerobolus stellatus SS14]
MFEALPTSASSYGSGIPSIIPSSNVVAASVVIFYNYILSLDDEIEFIWKYVLRSVAHSQPLIIFRIKGKSILGDSANICLTFSLHLLFCSNVFGVLRITSTGCVIWGWFQLMTVFAYYGRKSSVLIGLGTLLIGNIATAGGLVVFSLRDNNLIPNNNPAFHAGPCIGHSISNRYSSVWYDPSLIHTLHCYSTRRRPIFERQNIVRFKWSTISIHIRLGPYLGVRRCASCFHMVHNRMASPWCQWSDINNGTRLILSLRTSRRDDKDAMPGPSIDFKFNLKSSENSSQSSTGHEEVIHIH